MRKTISASLLCSASVVAVLAGVLPAFADENKIETVVVTAERRVENLQRSSIAATVLTAEDLQKKGVTKIDALQYASPALTISDQGDVLLFNIRGIGKSDGGVQDQSGTLVVVDGVDTSFSGFVQGVPYYDLASVEILRGPQGVFGGQNATGGAVYIKENDPTPDAFGGYGQASYGNYNDAEVQGALNIPLSDNAAIRIATDDEQRDSFYNIAGPWTGYTGNEHVSGRVSLMWQPLPQLTILWKNDYNYLDYGGTPAGPFPTIHNPFSLTANSEEKGWAQGLRSVLQINYVFPDGITLRSISGYEQGYLTFSHDVDGTSASDFYYSGHGYDRYFSQEVDLISPNDGPLTWVVGALYDKERPTIPPGAFDLSIFPGGALDFLLTYQTPKRSEAVFGDAKYKITDNLQAEVGLRYTDSHFEMSDMSTLSFGGFLVPYSNIVNEEEHDSRLTGKVALNWTIDDDNFVYVAASTGHKAGGINTSPSFFSPPGTLPPVFKAENVTNYEIGWKPTLFDGQMTAQVDAFYDLYNNFQVSVEDPSMIGFFKNVAGTTTVDGIEAQGNGQFGDIGFDFGGNYLNTSLGTFYAVDARSGLAPPCDPATGPAGAGCQNLTGRQQPNAPRWTFNAGVQYAFHLGNGDTLTPRLDYGMIGSQWATLFEVVSPFDSDHLGARNLLNAQLTLAMENNWLVALYGNNLTNLHYIESIEAYSPVIAGGPGNQYIAGPPLQFGIRVMKTF